MSDADGPDGPLILDWFHLEPEQIIDRINWLRGSMIGGTDWGYCEERKTCVIFNAEGATMYKLAWFEPDSQTIVHRPTMMKPSDMKQAPRKEDGKCLDEMRSLARLFLETWPTTN